MSLRLEEETPEGRVLELYREHGRRLYGFALGLVGDAADAEDVVQDAFLRLAQHLRAGGDARNLRAWLFRVATNLCRDVMRLRRRRAEAPREAAVEAEGALRAIALGRVFARLAPRDRKLVVMRGLGLSYAEMAEAADLRPSSVGTLLARALDRFADAYRREIATKEVD